MSEIEDAVDAADELAPLTEAIAAILPSGWKLETLGSLCEKSQYGWTTKADKDGQGVKFLRTTDITPGVVDWERVPYCVEAPPDLDKYLIREGDLLISRTGSIGVNYLVSNPEPAVFASYLIRFRPKKSISTNYLRYFLQSPTYWRAIAAGKKGIAVQNVNATMLSKIPVPVAPDSEQLEIVAEIEKQFSRLDQAVANLQRVKANLKRYKASVLKDAVEGRLVPTEAELARREGRSFETGEQLLQRILETRKSEWAGRGKYEEPSAVETGGLINLPNGWVWASAEQLSTFITKGTTPAAEKLLNAGIGDVQFLKVYNLTCDGTLNYAYKPAFVSRATHEGELLRSQVLAGDVLINIVGPPLGQVSVVPPTIAEANMNQAVARFRPIKPLSTKFVAHVLMAESIMAWAIRKAKTTAGQTNLTLDLCRRLPILLPPLAEQERIVAEVDRRLSLVISVQAEVDAGLKRAQALRQSSLRKAFGAS